MACVFIPCVIFDSRFLGFIIPVECVGFIRECYLSPGDAALVQRTLEAVEVQQGALHLRNLRHVTPKGFRAVFML